jgi:hypothetical protein
VALIGCRGLVGQPPRQSRHALGADDGGASLQAMRQLRQFLVVARPHGPTDIVDRPARLREELRHQVGHRGVVVAEDVGQPRGIDEWRRAIGHERRRW